MVSLSTLELVATITSITFLNFAYQNTGKAQELGEILSNIFPSTSLLAIIPAIFGLLPVSGGALLSAPLVDLEGDKLGIEKGRKAFLNLWFRHIPHLIYPLETALVIVSYLTGRSLTAIILYQVPVFIVGLYRRVYSGIKRNRRKEKTLPFQRHVCKGFTGDFTPDPPLDYSDCLIWGKGFHSSLHRHRTLVRDDGYQNERGGIKLRQGK